MSVSDTFFLFYCVLGVGTFTAAWMIAAAYVFVVGLKTVREWITAGQRVQDERAEIGRIAR